jgi:hypothetical protein
LDGAYLSVPQGSTQRLDPMIIEWRAKVTIPVGVNVNATDAAHMRVCQRDDGTCTYSGTLADVYFDSDGYVKLDNGYGSAPVSAGKWEPGVWTKLRLYFDWSHSNGDSLKVVLLRRPYSASAGDSDEEDEDAEDDDAQLTQAAMLTSPGCSSCQFFKALYLYNTSPDVVAYMDSFRFRDVSNMTVAIDVGGARYNASNVKIAYTRGDFENEPAEPAKDACNHNSSYYQSAMVKLSTPTTSVSGGTNVAFGQSLRVLILNNTKFKAYACAWANNSLSPTPLPTPSPTNSTAGARRSLLSTPGYIAYTSTTSSIAYNVASRPPILSSSRSTNFVETAESKFEAYDSFDVDVLTSGAASTWVKYASIVGNSPPSDPASCFGRSDGICGSSKCYGPYRHSCDLGLRLLPEATPTPQPTPTTVAGESTLVSRPSPSPTFENGEEDPSLVRRFCFRRNQYLLAISVEPGKLPSRVTMSARYTIKLRAPELKVLNDEFWPKWVTKAMGMSVDHVMIQIVSQSAGSFLVWSIGDGTQDDWSVGDGAQETPGDESWQLRCSLPSKYGEISWPERGIVESVFNDSRYWDNDGSCSAEYFAEPTVKVIRLDSEEANSLHVIACRDGNEPSTSAEIFVYIVARLELVATGLTCLLLAIFLAWYSSRVLQMRRRVYEARCILTKEGACINLEKADEESCNGRIADRCCFFAKPYYEDSDHEEERAQLKGDASSDGPQYDEDALEMESFDVLLGQQADVPLRRQGTPESSKRFRRKTQIHSPEHLRRSQLWEADDGPITDGNSTALATPETVAPEGAAEALFRGARSAIVDLIGGEAPAVQQLWSNDGHPTDDGTNSHVSLGTPGGAEVRASDVERANSSEPASNTEALIRSTQSAIVDLIGGDVPTVEQPWSRWGQATDDDTSSQRSDDLPGAAEVRADAADRADPTSPTRREVLPRKTLSTASFMQQVRKNKSEKSLKSLKEPSETSKAEERMPESSKPEAAKKLRPMMRRSQFFQKSAQNELEASAPDATKPEPAKTKLMMRKSQLFKRSSEDEPEASKPEASKPEASKPEAAKSKPVMRRSQFFKFTRNQSLKTQDHSSSSNTTTTTPTQEHDQDHDSAEDQRHLATTKKEDTL